MLRYKLEDLLICKIKIVIFIEKEDLKVLCILLAFNIIQKIQGKMNKHTRQKTKCDNKNEINGIS